MSQQVDLTKPHWKCVCGTAVEVLTFKTGCACKDPLAVQWWYVDPGKPATLAVYEAALSRAKTGELDPFAGEY